MERERFKILAHPIVGAGKSETYRPHWEAGNTGRVSMLQLIAKVLL